MLRNILGHDFTQLNKSSWKFSIARQHKTLAITKCNFCNFTIDSFGNTDHDTFIFYREIIKKWKVNCTEKVFPGCEKEACYEGSRK